MSRTKPAIYHYTDRTGRRWTIRVGPLGVEMLTNDANEYTHVGLSGEPFTCRHGQMRASVPWESLVPRLATEGGDS